MKQVTTMPQEGQFVAVWDYNGKAWSKVLRWAIVHDNGTGEVRRTLELYDGYKDYWYEIKSYQDVYGTTIYFVAGE